MKNRKIYVSLPVEPLDSPVEREDLLDGYKAAEMKRFIEQLKKNGIENELVRTTMDMPEQLHRATKMLVFLKGMSFKDYVLDLIRKDYQRNGLEL